jgi:anti-sigma factor RsiW
MPEPATTDESVELTCQELVELVTDYLEDALPPAERARMDAHLAACRGCRDYLHQMEATLRVVRATAPLEQRPEVAGLMRAFRDWKRGGGR